METKLYIKKMLLFTSLFIVSAKYLYPQENNGQNFFLKNLNHRIYTGLYSSYFNDNIKLMQAGYDCVLKLINITPNFNLLDSGIGLNALMAFDNRGGDHDGRPVNARITPGFELNWSIRLYVIPVPVINSRIFLEGLGMTLIVYAREYPDNGTNVNIGSHIGLGMEFSVNDYKVFTALRLFHSSNGKSYEKNPAINAVGLLIGTQFK